MITIALNSDQSPRQTEAEVAYPGRDWCYFLGRHFLDRRHDPRNWVWNNPVSPVTRSAFTQRWKIKKVKGKKHKLTANTNERKWQQLNFNFVSLPSPVANEKWVSSQLSSAAQFIFQK